MGLHLQSVVLADEIWTLRRDGLVFRAAILDWLAIGEETAPTRSVMPPTRYRSLDCQRLIHCKLLITGGEDDKSDLMVFNKLATFNGLVI